jgi:hypothetical protein
MISDGNPKKEKPLKNELSLIRDLLTQMSVISMLCILFCGVSAAQTVNSTVSGTVKDQAGAVVAGARVVLTDLATKLDVTSTTNQEGF